MTRVFKVGSRSLNQGRVFDDVDDDGSRDQSEVPRSQEIKRSLQKLEKGRDRFSLRASRRSKALLTPQFSSLRPLSDF